MITLYTKNNCPFCTRAKAFLSRNDIQFREINIEEVYTAREFLMENGHRTVPQIYYNNELLIEGGYAGLEKTDIFWIKKVTSEAA